MESDALDLALIENSILPTLSPLFSNLGVVPVDAETHDLSSLLILPVAIPLLLFRASLMRIYCEARFILLALLLCCVGAVIFHICRRTDGGWDPHGQYSG